MLHANLISALKAVPVGLAIAIRNMRVPKLIAIVHIRPTMIASIFPRAFDPIMKTMPLRLLKLWRRRVPRPLHIHRRRHGDSRLSHWTGNSQKARRSHHNRCNLPKHFHHVPPCSF